MLPYRLQLQYATGAQLLNYPDAPAPEGTSLRPEVAAAMPTVPISGVVKTAVGTLSCDTTVGLSPKTLSAKACASRIATGVRLSRLVTSPTA